MSIGVHFDDESISIEDGPMIFSSLRENYTDPNDYINTVKTTDSFGQTIHEVPKTMDQELEEFKLFFNKCSHEGQILIIQKIVKSFPDDARELLKEV